MNSHIIIVIGLICGALGLFLLPYGFDLWNRERQAEKGTLMRPTIDFQKPFEVNFGSNILTQTIQPGEVINLTKIVSYREYEYPIQIKFTESKLLISAEIKNKDGETIAKIVDNEWVVNNNKVIARDRNYNDYAFEVIDSDLIPALQVYLKGQNEIYIGGLFLFPEGKILVTPNGLFINPSSAQIDEGIKRIFRYPSDKYLGQMDVAESFLETRLGMATLVYGIATAVFIALLFLRGKI